MLCTYPYVGHTRYSTQGDSDHINIQPFVVETLQGRIAVAHNGELVNAKTLKRNVRQRYSYLCLQFVQDPFRREPMYKSSLPVYYYTYW